MSMENQACIHAIRNIFNTNFGQPEILVKSPGRINLIGEHTDYNLGFVLPAAINKAIYVAVGKRTDQEIHLVAGDLNEKFVGSLIELYHSDLGWPNYILGVADQLKKLDLSFNGFNAVIVGDVPLGAGLSSSAALECAMIYALNELYQFNLSKLEMVKLAQKSENDFVGLKCGIMDMFASMFGKANAVIQLDCRSLDYVYTPFDQTGIQIVLLDTCVKHSLASSEYNIRRRECETGVAAIQKKYPFVLSLRDVTKNMLEEVRANITNKVYERCKFIVDEIERLQAACLDLQQNNLVAFGKKMNQTHEGLSKLYKVSCEELDFLAEFAQANNHVLGSRMMGGGFGGCTINLVKESGVKDFIQNAEIAFRNEFHTELKSYIVSIGEGTSKI